MATLPRHHQTRSPSMKKDDVFHTKKCKNGNVFKRYLKKNKDFPQNNKGVLRKVNISTQNRDLYFYEPLHRHC